MAKYKKKLEFPAHVLEVKQKLEASGDERLAVMKKLTEPKELDSSIPDSKQPKNNSENDYYTMWRRLYKVEKKAVHRINKDNSQPLQDITDAWVYGFLDDVIEAQKTPVWALKKNEDWQNLIKDINKHTKELQSLYNSIGLEMPLIRCDVFHGGFFAQEMVEENGIRDWVSRTEPDTPTVDALGFLADYAVEEIQNYIITRKRGENHEAISFVHTLARKNYNSYKQTLNSVLKAAAYALYDTDYSDSDIHNLLNGRKTSKR